MTLEIAETNVSTGEFVQREMTAEEIAKDAAHIAEVAAEEAAIKAKADKSKSDKAALLAKLGITDAEAKLLLS